MLKGVNKQIVEINYTKDDYIEKAILIINPDKSKLSKELINARADAYMKKILEQPQSKPVLKESVPDKKKNNRLFKLFAFGASTVLFLSLAAAVFSMVIQ